MNVYEKIDKYKAAIDIIRPFEGEMLKQIRDYYRIGLTYTSNALEGNSLTEIETKILLEDGLTSVFQGFLTTLNGKKTSGML